MNHPCSSIKLVPTTASNFHKTSCRPCKERTAVGLGPDWDAHGVLHLCGLCGLYRLCGLCGFVWIEMPLVCWRCSWYVALRTAQGIGHKDDMRFNPFCIMFLITLLPAFSVDDECSPCLCYFSHFKCQWFIPFAADQCQCPITPTSSDA